MFWPSFKRGDRVKANDKASDHLQGKTAICIADNTETPFGHKHVQIQFSDGTAARLRTYELDLVQSFEEFCLKGGHTPPALDNAVGKFDATSRTFKAGQS